MHMTLISLLNISTVTPSLDYTFHRVNLVGKRIGYSWPTCNSLSGCGSLHPAKGQAKDASPQLRPHTSTQTPDLLEECGDSVAPWNSLSSNLSPYPKTPRYDWMCSPTASTKGPHQWGLSLQRTVSYPGDPSVFGPHPRAEALLLSSVSSHVWGIRDWDQCYDAFIIHSSLPLSPQPEQWNI